MDSKGIIRKRLEQHYDVIGQILADEKLQDMIAQITETIVTCFKYGGRVYFCGNGGSAADAQHLAAEFSGKFYLFIYNSCFQRSQFRHHLRTADFWHRQSRRCIDRPVYIGQFHQYSECIQGLPRESDHHRSLYRS